MPSASEQDTVRVAEIALVVEIRDTAPSIAAEVMIAPSRARETKVSIPVDAGPIQFQTLYLKLCGGIFEIVARPRILFFVEEPMYRINVYPNINRMRFKPLGF